MNVDRLRKLAAFLREHDDRVQMGNWIAIKRGEGVYSLGTGEARMLLRDFTKVEHHCETVACIAGWGVILFNEDRDDGKQGGGLYPNLEPFGVSTLSVQEYASLVLDLSEIHARWLFLGHTWPEDFKERLERSPDSHGQIAADYIEWFIGEHSEWKYFQHATPPNNLSEGE